MPAAGLSRSLTWFCCPDCTSEFAQSESVLTCPVCGRTVSILGPNLLRFLPGDDALARTILDWPGEFVQRLKTWDGSRGSGEIHIQDFQERLAHHRLIRSDGSLTSLGKIVQYHVSEYQLQAGREPLDGMLELDAVGPRVRALDVGCGAAQTLRLLGPDRPVELVGVDVDLAALALGCRFALLEGLSVTLAMASAYALPFRECSFDLVLTRVALNYMHQRQALTEMVRVLRPGGYLFCGVERIWHDLSYIAQSRSVRGFVCRCLDLNYGVVHSLVGWQPTPGSTLRGGRTFATARRLGRILNSLGCRVCRVSESPFGTAFMGRRHQLIVIAQRQPSDR
jgi:SAM-dependent methyltransferase